MCLLKMDYRVLVFDLDGTLLESGQNISPKILIKIDILKKLGFKVTIATGRTLLESNALINQVSPNWPAICLDGQLIYDQRLNKVLYRESLPIVNIEQLKERFFRDFYFIEESEFSIHIDNRVVGLMFCMTFGINRKDITFDFKGNCFVPTRVYLRQKNNENIINPKMVLKVKELAGENIEVFQPGEKWLILKSRKCDKAKALSMLCKDSNMPLSKVIAFGDGSNDINLINAVGMGVAMNNSCDELKNIARIKIEQGNIDAICIILDEIIKYSEFK